VAQSYRPVPIQFWLLFLAVRCRSEGRKEKDQGRLTGETKSGEDVRGVDGELAPMMNVGDGVVDDAQRTMATSNPWSSTTGASRGDGEGWLETTAASVVIGGLEKLREKVGQAII
jgi:hypothetical protein